MVGNVDQNESDSGEDTEGGKFVGFHSIYVLHRSLKIASNRTEYVEYVLYNCLKTILLTMVEGLANRPFKPLRHPSALKTKEIAPVGHCSRLFIVASYRI